MPIPSKFTLFATEYEVYYDSFLDGEGLYGQFVPSRNVIRLALTHETSPLNPSIQEATFYHEKVHAILHEMNETELYENEKFVDLFSKLLMQSDKTAIYQ